MSEVAALERQVARTAALLPRHHPGWHVEFVASIDSTSSELRRRAADCALARPILLVAGEQTAGRGRAGKTWWSAPGQSLLFTAAIPVAQVGAGGGEPYPLTLVPLQLAMALGVRLRQLGWEATVKWPNDIVLEDRKVGGLLTEVLDGWLLAGVGINLSQEAGAFPESASSGALMPGSLAMAARDGGGAPAPSAAIPSLLQSVVAVLETPWERSRMLRWYRQWCITIGRQVEYDFEGTPVRGRATGVTDLGALEVEGSDGAVRIVTSEVRTVPA